MVFSPQQRFSNSFGKLPDAFYSRVLPTPFEKASRLIHFNPRAAELLGLPVDAEKDPDFVRYFSGKILHPNADPIAMLYAGHQFGYYVPQLGDGRAILLAEIVNAQNQRWEIQLKGSGQTPYSRDGDGRAVLRSTVREYLCSEAMAGLGIPTTRALCMIGSQDEVYREKIETGAMLTRLAPSHVRFGSFEVFYYRSQYAHLQTLADYVIDHHYPELSGLPDRYGLFLRSVVERTARLIAQWQAVGFSHGVMNTDNMSILGITLDYGPFGFMEAFDPGFICNHSDHDGRYAFDQQPAIAYWNLTCLAQALSPLMEMEQIIAALGVFEKQFAESYSLWMAQKIGFDAVDQEATQLVGEWLAQMRHATADYSNTFRALAQVKRDSDKVPAVSKYFADGERFKSWLTNYRTRLQAVGKPDAQRKAGMDRVNPKFVLRNYLAQIAIDKAEKDDYSEVDTLLALLQDPFSEHPQWAQYAEPPPAWAGHIHVSCSS